MKATIELTPVVLQACLLGKRLSANNEGLDEWRVIKSVRTIEVRENMTVFCFGMLNAKRSGMVVIPGSVVQALLETGEAAKQYTKKSGEEYWCHWFLKDGE